MAWRIGRHLFRTVLLNCCGDRGLLTGITDPALLRASHIVRWADCDDDAQRLDVHNGLLLSALWDAAFDAGLASFADDGSLLVSTRLGVEARQALGVERAQALSGLTTAHDRNLVRHRVRYGF